MFVILVYDIREKRVGKVLKLCRKYLNWVQNSVFEGDMTKAKLIKFKMELKKIIDEKEDSILIYKFRTLKYYEREVVGKEKQPIDNII
jgi:CRISPR-associated protein Cas2